MPMGNGTGPEGEGPRTGRGRGGCRGSGRRFFSSDRRPDDRRSSLENWVTAIGTTIGLVASVVKLFSSKKQTRQIEKKSRIENAKRIENKE